MSAGLTVERLRALLATEPRVFWFEMSQTRAEREEMLNTVPLEAQGVARRIMLDEVLEGYCTEENLEQPLLWFMATDDVDCADDDWLRQHSYDWRLILFSDDRGFLCDFNGWPGDNESGAGIYYDRATGDTELVFINSDMSLTNELADQADETIQDYAERRQSLGKETEEGVAE